MPASAIISYDGTTHDDDALALGRMLSGAGMNLSLAYVRHSREYDPRREEIAGFDAERRLEQGAVWLDAPDIPRLIVVDPSTSAGLARLASEQHADVILFGSDYRTPPGRVEPGGAAQGLLDGGSVAIGVAAAGLRTQPDAAIRTISVAGEPGGAASETAGPLGEALGATVVAGRGDADLILVDSQPAGPAGRISLGGSSRAQLDSAHGSVIVLPRGVALRL